MHYYGTRLSENISRREPEGYLLCLNVPVARTGTQDYLPEELGLPGSSFMSVFRPEEEVFSPETMASFEGMPVTNDHPPEGVDVSNIRALQKGHAHNVRRGGGDESDLLLADLIITDPHLIDLILDGKREISCGYTYELCEENGQYIQRKIRGNHVAVVDAGRAGKRVAIRDHKGCSLSATTQAPLEPAPRVSIKDEQPVQISDLGNRCRATGTRDWRAAGEDRAAVTIADHKASISERRKPNMKKSLSKILARMAKDGDIETVAEIIEEMIEPEAAAEETVEGEALTTAGGGNLVKAEVSRNKQAPQSGAAPIEAAVVAEAVAEVAEEPAAVFETAEGTTVVVDEASLADVISRLDQIISLLTPAARDEDPVEEIVEAVEEAVEAAAEAEAVAELPEAAEEVAAIVEEILEPEGEELAEVISGDECEEPEPEVLSTGDALRAALRAVGPALAKMPRKQRQRVCADIAARLNGKGGRKGADAGIYAALAAARRKPAADPKDLGRRIMEKRSANRVRK